MAEHSLKSIDGGRADDPFDEAGAAMEELSGAVQDGNVDLNLPEDAKQAALVKPQKLKPKKAPAKKGKGVAFTAIGISLIAIGMSGYSMYSQKGMHGELTEQMTSVESYATDLRLQTEKMVSQMASNTEAIGQNTAQIQSLSDMRGEMVAYNSAFDKLTADLQGVRGSLFEEKALIDDQRNALKELTGRVSTLESRPTKTVTTVVRTSTPARQPKADASKLEGASLASVDAWGSKTNVMLRDEDGQWIPLSQGDFYKGWQLVKANGSEAIFKGGKKTRTLQVEG